MPISKQQACQKYIYKIHSSRLRKAKWKLTLPIDEARKNEEVISLADSQVLRWIDELNGCDDADEKARQIKRKIKKLKKEPNSVKQRHAIKQLYADLDNIQYKKDYMCLIIDKVKDYYRAVKGFSINGIIYKRLLGTNGGIKNSTIVFVSERHLESLKQKIFNDRDPSGEYVPAKLEAYQALTCSASVPVSFPRGIAVVDDCETSFLSDIVYLTDEFDGEPIMTEKKDEPITIDASDGFGLMLPSLAERWSRELHLEYMMSGANTRFSYEKGVAFTFDFVDFAERIAGGNYIIHDAWGNEVDVRNVELILTTSMVKLWDSYQSCDDYVQKSLQNGYTFAITKTCPKELENERSLNYQFIQSYDLTDEDIDELIAPTVSEIKEVLNGDWRKTILFLKGVGLNEKNIDYIEDDFVKAIMIDRRMIQDPFVQSNIFQMIRNRINEAKVGVLKVHGNYSIVSGDPYALCQSMFGLPVTGLLKAGEIYNKYWADDGAETLACFRAPMSCHENIRAVHPASNDDVNYWYRYMNTCTILNAWDTTTAALNGCDYDGDIVMLTDNPVLVRNLHQRPALMCAQRKADKIIPTEDDLIESNIASFGNDIGKITNRVTSMYEVRSHYPKGSREYETLSYRIQCGQLFQQNAIDRAKGIICKPMPQTWYNRRAIWQEEDYRNKELDLRIVADKKPYFMRYIYPSLMKEYNRYIKRTNSNALKEFRMDVDELQRIRKDKLTERQSEFLRYYDHQMPVGTGDCVMNKICKKIEREFDHYLRNYNKENSFDFSFLKSGEKYTAEQRKEVARLYDEYNKRLQTCIVNANADRSDKYAIHLKILMLNDEFIAKCYSVCSNRYALCDLILDLCYTHSKSRKFAWSVCGDVIIHNLLRRNNYIISFPVYDRNGDIEYAGNKFRLCTKTIEVDE